MEEIAKLAARPVEAAEGDYMEDGLLHCGKCRTPKQCRVELLGRVRTVACLCRCRAEEAAAEQAEQERRREMVRISQMRAAALMDRNYQQWTFEKDDGKRPEVMEKARRYCAKWPEMYRRNIGLLLWGGVGTGKTFLASCIANELLGRNVPVLTTNFIRLANAVNTGWGEDRNAYIRSLNAYRLLVIDDLGAERTGDKMLEDVYAIIDGRYTSGQPVIITTNLTLDEMKNPPDRRHARIYDRVLEMTVPLDMRGESRRKAIYTEKRSEAVRLLLEGDVE